MYVINKHKIAKACLLASASLLLANCGFGGRDADPLRGKDEAYVSQAQKQSETERQQAELEAAKQEYTEAITAKNASIAAQAKAMEALAAQNKANYEKEQHATVQQCQAKVDKYVAETAVAAKKCSDSVAERDAHVAELTALVEEFDARAANPERQNFEGILHEFEADSLKAPSFTFISGEESKYEVKFFLKAGNKAVQDFNFIGDKPEGLEFSKSLTKENVWILSGTPTQEIPNGKSRIETKYTIGPDVNYDLIENEVEKAEVKRNYKVFTKDIRIVIEKAILAPKVVTTVDKASSDIKIVVTDPASLTRDSQPSIIISGKPAGGDNNTKIINGAALITASADVEPVRRKDGSWVFHYVLNESLVSEDEMGSAKKVFANFSVQAQSRASGLLSPPENEESIELNLKGEQ